MSAWGRALAALGLVRAQALASATEAPRVGWDWGGDFPVSPTMDPLYQMSAMARFSWVYAVVTARAEDAATVPLVLVRGRGKSATRIEEHPVLDLIQRPSTTINGGLFAAQMVADRVLTGCSYAMVVGKRQPSSVIRLHPERTRAISAPDGTVSAWEYGHDRLRYEPGVVIQIRGISWEDSPSGLYGQGIIRALADQLAAELAALEREKISQKTGRPSVIITPKSNADGLIPQLSPEQIRDIERKVNQALLAGSGKAIALSGMLDLQTPGWKPSEMESEALHTRVRDAVLASAGVPPSRLSLVTANYATAKEELASYWRSTVASDVRGLCELWSEVARRWGPALSVEPDWTGVSALQVNRTEQVNRVISHTMLGMSVADAYAYEGLADAPVSDALAPAPAAPSATSVDQPAVAGAPAPRAHARAEREAQRSALWRAAEGRLRLPMERDLQRRMLLSLRAELRDVADAVAKALPTERAAGSRAVPSIVDSIMDQILGSRVGPAYDAWIGPARERAWRAAAQQVAPDRLSYKPQTELITERTATLIVDTTETSKATIRRIVEQGLDSGKTNNEIQADIMAAANFDAERALRIARTETTAAVSASQVQAYTEAEEIGVPVRMEWLTSRDAGVRESHRRMDGQIVKIGEDFKSPTGATGPGPGEMSRAEDSINCRCTIIPVLD